jgi:hypothetical protein
MSARQMIDIAAAAGIRLAAEGDKLIAECARPRLKQNGSGANCDSKNDETQL